LFCLCLFELWVWFLCFGFFLPNKRKRISLDKKKKRESEKK
jgi:hypothetical protein